MARGFTLIELSIILIIIGLIVGGIVAGQEMISNAALRSSLSQLESYEIAATTFKQKYNALPGDIATPQNFGLGVASGIGSGGNGDDRIFIYRYWDNTSFTASNQRTEIFNFWYHLSQANLINEAFTGVANSGSITIDLTGYMPKLGFASSPTFAVPGTALDVNTQEAFGNSWSLVSFSRTDSSLTCPGGPTNVFCQTLTALEAWKIDSKRDDSIPRSGNVRQMYPSVGPYWSGNGVQACDNATQGAVYDIKGVRNTSTIQSPAKPESIDCSLIVKAKW